MDKNGNECWRSGNGLGKENGISERDVGVPGRNLARNFGVRLRRGVRNFGVGCRVFGSEFSAEFQSRTMEWVAEFRSRTSEYGTELERNFGVEIWYMTKKNAPGA